MIEVYNALERLLPEYVEALDRSPRRVAWRLWRLAAALKEKVDE